MQDQVPQENQVLKLDCSFYLEFYCNTILIDLTNIEEWVKIIVFSKQQHGTRAVNIHWV